MRGLIGLPAAAFVLFGAHAVAQDTAGACCESQQQVTKTVVTKADSPACTQVDKEVTCTITCDDKQAGAAPRVARVVIRVDGGEPQVMEFDLSGTGQQGEKKLLSKIPVLLRQLESAKSFRIEITGDGAESPHAIVTGPVGSAPQVIKEKVIQLKGRGEPPACGEECDEQCKEECEAAQGECGSICIVDEDGQPQALKLDSSGRVLSWVAQDDEEFAIPLGATGTVQPGAKISMFVSSSDGDDTYTLRMTGDDLSVDVNGKPVPADRIKRTEGKVQVLDENGEVVHTFTIGRGLGGFTVSTGDLAKAPPKVMIGIHMGTPSQELIEQLGLDPDAVQISHVVEGLPADKAGLKTGDIVVAIDGKSPATQALLHEVLGKKSPGDELELTVLRKGREVEIEIELAAWNAEALGVPMTLTIPGMDIEALRAPEGLPKLGDQFHEGWGGNLTEEARKALEDALAAAEKAQKDAIAAYRNDDGEFMLFGKKYSDLEKQTQAQITKLQGRLDELDKRLSELDKRIERLIQAIKDR